MKINIGKYIAKVAIFSALSIILYYIKFPLPFFPSFLEIQFSTIPAILAGFVLGPIGGIAVVVIKFLVKLASSHTLFIGEFSDLIIGLSVVLTTSLFYKNNKTKKGGLVALILGVIVWVSISVLSNWLLIMPAYIKAFGLDNVIAMLVDNFKNINEDNFMTYYLLLAVLPFNLLLSVSVSTITFFVYKRVSIIFKKDFFN